MSWQRIGVLAAPEEQYSSDLKEIEALRAEVLDLKRELSELTAVKAEVAKLVDLTNKQRIISPEIVADLVTEHTAKAIACIPQPAESASVSGALIDRSGHLVLTFSDGRTQDVGEVVGRSADTESLQRFITEEIAKIPVPKDGKDGRDGIDGMGFDDYEVTYDGARTITLTLRSGDRVRQWPFTAPVPIWKGIWQEGSQYEPGEAVTWAGSYWVCTVANAVKPNLSTEESRSSWKLAVRKGQDGKQGPAGRDGKNGRDGKDR